MCTHTPRSITTGSSYSKHSLQLPETLYNRKTVASHQGKIYVPTVFGFTAHFPNSLYKLLVVLSLDEIQAVSCNVCMSALIDCIAT